MKYTKLGRTGLDVSRICLGCMSYGGGNRGNHAWSLGEEESRPFIKKALEAGISSNRTGNILVVQLATHRPAHRRIMAAIGNDDHIITIFLWHKHEQDHPP